MNNVKDLQTIEETLKYLQFDNWEQSAPGLARSRELLGLLGNPEQKLKFVRSCRPEQADGLEHLAHAHHRA